MNRSPIASPPQQTLNRLSRSTILITGAGGSIGGELTQRLAALQPKSLVLLEASEQSLYRLQTYLKLAWPQAHVAFYLGSVSNAVLLDEILAAYAPEYVFHAAAHKHLPLLEEHPLAAIENNVLGTVTLMNCAVRHASKQPSRILLLSTDKAADPTSILGATKRIAEQVVIAQQGVALRLVNVLGSEGSVVETFLDQISQGKPLTISHPDAERYFMTAEEAVDLLISAAVNAAEGSLLAPPIARPQKVVALAHFLASHSENSSQIDLEHSGLRDGEKLREVLFAADERPGSLDATGCIPIQQIDGLNMPHLETLLDALGEAVNRRDGGTALQIIRDLAPSYKPSATVIDTAHPLTRSVQS